MKWSHLAFCCSMWTVAAGARPSAEKAMAVRAEAESLVDAIVRGQGGLSAQVNRVKYLGEEAWVSVELAARLRKAVDPQGVRNIAQALAELAHPAAEGALLQLLGSDDGATRMHAVSGLGKMKSAQAVPRLVQLLSDKSVGVRREAARALGLSRSPKAGAALVAAARGEGEVDARAQMLIAAGQSADKRQIPALEAFLDDSSETTRFAAAQALCALGGKKGFEVARKRLQSADRYERILGLKLFEGARAREVGGVLEPMLKDPDRGVAAMAARILYQGGDAKKLDWLVLQSFQAVGEAKLPFEQELEALRLPDDQRRAILARAGIR
jgi:hypothetical protein